MTVYDELLGEMRAIRKLLEDRLQKPPPVLLHRWIDEHIDPAEPVRETPRRGKIT